MTQRRARLAELRSIDSTLIFYEAPHRIRQALTDAREILGEREATVARELTKLHEEIVRGRLSELIERFSAEDSARGEMVLLIARARIEVESASNQPEADIATLVADLESKGLDNRAALKRAARELGLRRSEAYRRLVAERERRKKF